MSSNDPQIPSSRRRQRRRQSGFYWLLWLDVLAFATWGILLLQYWLRGKLNLLIHPNYHWLVVVTGIALIGIAGFRALQLLQSRRQQRAVATLSHVSLFPRGWSSTLLLVAAILGLTITPRAFTSQTALQRGVSDFLPATRSQPQTFRSANRPEDRTLVGWVRTLSVYPEPDTYIGQPVKVKGFVVYPPNTELPAQYLLIARFIVTCCAADAYPVGLPVKLTEDRKTYPPDTWIEVKGQMIVEELNNQRQLTIDATAIAKIPEPENPYEY